MFGVGECPNSENESFKSQRIKPELFELCLQKKQK